MQQFSVPAAAVLPTSVGVHEQAERRRLGPKSALQGLGNQLFGHSGHAVLACYLLADHTLIGIQVSPVAIGQRQIGAITEPDLIRLQRLGLVEQPARGAAQLVHQVCGAWGEGLRLQRVQDSSAHGGTPTLVPHAVSLAA
jgi:hypothetical protein